MDESPPKGIAIMDLSIEDEDTPPPFFQRRSTWLFGLALLVGIGLLGWWFKVDSVKKDVTNIVASNQFDAAESKLKSSQGWLGDCDRYGLLAFLAKSDERKDTLALKMADSLRGCSVSPDSILELVSLGNLRISDHDQALDSSARWTLQTNAFTAASACVKADSANKSCRSYGFLALVGMKDSYAQVNWMSNALARWPNDSAFLQMAELARRANDSVKLAAAKPSAPAPTVAPKIPTKKKRK
jgi:hypothetical protein